MYEYAGKIKNILQAEKRFQRLLFACLTRETGEQGSLFVKVPPAIARASFVLTTVCCFFRAKAWIMYVDAGL